jgi:hypothetical protein
MAQAMAKLPHSFTTLPAPGSAPKLYTRLPVARRTRLKIAVVSWVADAARGLDVSA